MCKDTRAVCEPGLAWQWIALVQLCGAELAGPCGAGLPGQSLAPAEWPCLQNCSVKVILTTEVSILLSLMSLSAVVEDAQVNTACAG